MKFNPATTSPIVGGAFLSTRRLPGNVTLITPAASLGSIILAPGSTLVSIFSSDSRTEAIEGFSWWEVAL
ncbi:hypothetical protein NXZ84_05730 [Mechercharimyces sp. CAU 1602]|nr:hypothetical protein [Mechercharimyces sp. CAU 1602]